jgi:hypothetical protein
MPRIGVIENPRQPGADNLSDAVPAQTILPVTDVFEHPFESDAHFTCYYPSGSNFTQKQWPRLNKPTLAKLRSAEVDLKFPLLAIDIDNPGHLPWASDDAVKHFFESLEHASKEFPLSTRWWCAYTTRHGARLVYILGLRHHRRGVRGQAPMALPATQPVRHRSRHGCQRLDEDLSRSVRSA